MENYFILLGLSFDPIETDESKIKAAIEAKRDQWQKEAKNPRKQIQAKERLASIPQIQEVMLNASKRKLEAEKASQILAGHIQNLKNEIMLLSVKGYIEEEEYDQLVNKYTELSVNQDIIDNLITVPVGDEADELELEEIETISDDAASQLTMYFSNLGIDDMSIYSFYGIPDDSSAEDVIASAQAHLKQILDKGRKDNKDEIEQKLSGIIINIFKEDQELYNNFLGGCRFIKLNELIKTAVSKNKLLTVRTFQTLISIIRNTYEFNKQEAANYIITNCVINHYEISQDTIMEYARIQNEENDNDEENEISVPQPTQQTREVPTMELINNMLTPINTTLVTNRNNTNQLASHLKQYREKREANGSAMPTGLSYICFGVSGILTAVDIFLIATKLLAYSNPLVLLFTIICLALNVTGALMVYRPFSVWKKMIAQVDLALKNNEEQTKVYEDFTALNFNLLVEDNEKIVKKLNALKEKSDKLLEATKKAYQEYLATSKKYVQSPYIGRVYLGIIAGHIAVIAFTVFFM